MMGVFKITVVGAGPGVAVFTCDRLLGDSVEVVYKADYDKLGAELTRLRYILDMAGVPYESL